MAADNCNKYSEWDAYRQFKMRKENACFQLKQLYKEYWPTNGDEYAIPQFIGMYSKFLPHDEFGRVLPEAYEKLRKALITRNNNLLFQVPLGGSLKLTQPLAGLSINLAGPASSSIYMPPPPSMSSDQSAGEMVIDYCHVLARDVPFIDYPTDPVIANCVTYISALPVYTGQKPVTVDNVFRSKGVGCEVGPYISQLLYMPVKIWPDVIAPLHTFPTHTAANDRLFTEASFLAAQNGSPIGTEPTISATPTYITCGRDLAYYVTNDIISDIYDITVRVLLQANAPFSPTNPYTKPPYNINMHSFINWNVEDVSACLRLAGQISMRGGWYPKWQIYRRLRPEEFGGEVEQWRLTGQNPANISQVLLTSDVLADIFTAQGNYYLAQTNKSGSPGHPAYPSGHGVFSGACGTVIKAFYDEDWVFPNPVIASSDGLSLVATTDVLTLGHEINKLMENVGIGRNWAGFHYDSDCTAGILYGEKIAYLVLQDWIEQYPEKNVSFRFHSYQGDEIVIEPRTKYGSILTIPK